MGLTRMLAHFGRRMLGRIPELESPIGSYRICRVEELEARQLMAADLQMGAVYYDPHAGDGLQPQLFYINFQGGASGTELTHLTINLNKSGTANIVDPGPLSNDDFFHTASSTYMSAQGFPFAVVNSGGVTVTNASVQNDSTELDLDFSGFTAGKTLVFSIKVDEAQDPNNVVVEGAEFQGAQLTATFSNPNYYAASGSATFNDVYDFSDTSLTLPPDDYVPPSSIDESVYTAGAETPLAQTPLPSTLAGIVYVDKTGLGTYQPGDTLLSGVNVELLDQNGDVVSTQMTGANGAYSFGGLLPGTYSIKEIQPSGYLTGGDYVGSLGGTASDANDLTSIPVGPNQNGVNYNFYVVPPNSINGVVEIEPSQGHQNDPSDTPLAGVSVELTNVQGAVVATTTTNASGQYSFQNLYPGTYEVHEFVPTGYFAGDDQVGTQGGTANGLTEIDAIALSGGVVGANYNFFLLVPNSISGTVEIEPSEGHQSDPADTPLSGVTVELFNAEGTLLASAATDSGGKYSFQNLMPGTYVVREIKPSGYFDGDIQVGSQGGVANGLEEIDSVGLAGGVHGINYNFFLLQPNSISGMVAIEPAEGHQNDPANTPLAGVTVELLNAQGQHSGHDHHQQLWAVFVQ